MTENRRQTVFAGLDRPPAWPATRGGPRPRRLDAPLDTLPGVGATLRRKLASLGLETVRDLLEHRPFRYETAADEIAIADLHGDDEVVIVGDVLNVSSRPLRGRRVLVKARISDGTATITAAWFNQPWVAEKLRPGVRVRLRGKAGRLGFDVKSWDVGETRATADFAPVYPASEQITPKRLRGLVAAALQHANDYGDALPAELRAGEMLPLERDAIVAIHQPSSEEEAETARQRLAFDELLFLQFGIARRAAARAHTLAPSLGEPGELIARYRKALPFALTPYQEQAIREIDEDLARTTPMQRLLQGDVGSGKTVVALYALLRAVERGRQGALMAPTVTLAEQHFATHRRSLPRARRGVLTAPGERASKQAARHRRADVVVGTHALIQEGVELARPRRRRRRRAAPLRRRAAPALAEGRGAAPAAHDRDADPAHARAHRVRRPRAVDDRESRPRRASRSITRWIAPRSACAEAYTRLDAAAARGPAGVRRVPADRAVGDERRARRRSGGGAAAARRAARVSASAACTAGCAADARRT